MYSGQDLVQVLNSIIANISPDDPLQYSMDSFQIPDGKLVINTVNIVDDKILVDGIIFIPKK